MKVNYGNRKMVEISLLLVGSTFLADRKDKADGRAIYMVVDKNNGVIPNGVRTYDKTYAVNLQTGQLRPFQNNTCVEKIDCELNVY